MHWALGSVWFSHFVYPVTFAGSGTRIKRSIEHPFHLCSHSVFSCSHMNMCGLEKISNCYYMAWYCNWDTICILEGMIIFVTLSTTQPLNLIFKCSWCDLWRICTKQGIMFLNMYAFYCREWKQGGENICKWTKDSYPPPPLWGPSEFHFVKAMSSLLSQITFYAFTKYTVALNTIMILHPSILSFW